MKFSINSILILVGALTPLAANAQNYYYPPHQQGVYQSQYNVQQQQQQFQIQQQQQQQQFRQQQQQYRQQQEQYRQQQQINANTYYRQQQQRQTGYGFTY